MNVKSAKEDIRDSWEIDEDYRCVKRAIEVFKDPDRLKDVQNKIKEKKEIKDSLEAVADGNLQKALGVVSG